MQGDTTLKTPELRVTYEGKAADSLTSAKAEAPKADAASGGSRLSRMVASKGAVITMGADRRIAGEQADFDAKADTALFLGNVLINQQKNVLQGRRLFVDRKSGQEPPRHARRGWAAGRPHRRDLISDRGQGGVAQAREVRRRGDGERRARAACWDPSRPIPRRRWTSRPTPWTSSTPPSRPCSAPTCKAQQGDMVIRTVELTAFYTGQSGFGMGGPGERCDKAA